MPYFSVLAHGKGIAVPVQGTVAASFFVWVNVRAADAKQASLMATQRILDEWQTGGLASRNKGALPTMSIEEVRSIGFLAWLRRRRTGYIFAPHE